MLKHFYKVSVFRANYKGIFSAMTILCQSVSLVMMTCIAIVAINNKFNDLNDLGTIGLSITFSLKISDLVSSIVSDLSRLEILMKIYIVSIIVI